MTREEIIENSVPTNGRAYQLVIPKHKTEGIHRLYTREINLSYRRKDRYIVIVASMLANILAITLIGATLVF